MPKMSKESLAVEIVAMIAELLGHKNSDAS